MGNTDGGSRIIGACTACGSMYAAVELSGGGVLPIGSRDGCTSCGGTEFVALSELSIDDDSD
ncbi:hypothetical protein OB905_02000 [Halobacteria archaeon AArc-dxtr1]|nr:hypothetical protein [Halobacteria archaeon AArc-dxtr1]